VRNLSTNCAPNFIQNIFHQLDINQVQNIYLYYLKVTKHVEIHVFCDVKDVKELARFLNILGYLNILGDVDQIKYRPTYENKNTKEK